MTRAQRLVGYLRIDAGGPTARPTADFWCGRCGAFRSACGYRSVGAFAATIRQAHALVCPATPAPTTRENGDPSPGPQPPRSAPAGQWLFT